MSDSGVDNTIHYIDFAASIITVVLFLISVFLYFKSKKVEKTEEGEEKNIQVQLKDQGEKIDKIITKMGKKTLELKL